MIPTVFGILLLFGGLALIVWGLNIFTANKKVKEAQAIVHNRNKDRKVIFSPGEKIGNLQVDDFNRLFRFENSGEVFSFDELSSFKVFQDNAILTSGASGVVLNAGFDGPAQATTTTNKVERLNLVYIVDGLNQGKYTHSLLSHPTEKHSETYQLAMENMEDMIAFFQAITKTS